MINVSSLQFLLLVLTGWLDRREREALAYLMEENRLLRCQLGSRRLRLTDDDRRRLAARAHRLGRRALREVTPDTLLRWHRQLIARKWTFQTRRPRRLHVLADIDRLVVRMATDNPTWGYTRIQGALKNLGHRVGRSTIARMLKRHGLPPVPRRPTALRTFLRVHWGVIAGADFFTTEVWTWRGLVTYYTVFTIDLASRRVHMLGSTPNPNEAFMRQVGRTLTFADTRGCRLLICDRDAKWSPALQARLADAGQQVVRTPYQAPNANAHAERFVRSIKEECLNRLVPLGDRHFRLVIAEYLEHYHRERNHQGLHNELIAGAAARCGPSVLSVAARDSVGFSIFTRELRERTSAERWDSTRPCCRSPSATAVSGFRPRSSAMRSGSTTASASVIEMSKICSPSAA